MYQLSVTFYDDTPQPLRFREEDIRNIVLGGVVAHHKMLEIYVATETESEEELRREYSQHLDEMPIWHAYKLIYDYVSSGIYPAMCEDDLHAIIKMAISFRFELVYANEFYGFDIGTDRTDDPAEYRVAIHSGRALEILLCGFYARWKLDAPGKDDFAVRFWDSMFKADPQLLSLSEIAILADIQERSVRNYTLSTRPEEERLKTVKVGGRTLVTPEDAKAWLVRRRRFIPTRFPEESASAEEREAQS